MVSCLVSRFWLALEYQFQANNIFINIVPTFKFSLVTTDSDLFWYNTVQSGTSLCLQFLRVTIVDLEYCLLAQFIFRPWSWRQYIPQKSVKVHQRSHQHIPPYSSDPASVSAVSRWILTAPRVVRRRGSYIFKTISSKMAVRLSALLTGRPLLQGNRYWLLNCCWPSPARIQDHFTLWLGRPVTREVNWLHPILGSGFEPRSFHVGFLVDRGSLGQAFSQYFGFPCQSFHRLLHTQRHLWSEAGKISQMVADMPNGRSLIPTPWYQTK
jgi:hypothetical protein